MNDVRRALSHWIEEPTAAVLHPVASSGFSGAQLWQVEQRDKLFSLRRWPPAISSEGRLNELHSFQRRLSSNDCPVPVPVVTLRGLTYAEHEGALWELATWMPGIADYWRRPSPAKLRAALATLANIHIAEGPLTGRAKLLLSRSDEPSGSAGASPSQTSPALQRRGERLERLERGELAKLASAVSSAADGREKSTATQALELIAICTPLQLRASQQWRETALPLQWRLGDVWHDHVLFTGDCVTGVIDFGAAAIDSPAGDVARLLGSLVGDDADGWRLGLEAYVAIRPMSLAELEAIRFFDSSGTVLSAVNWLYWLYCDPAGLDPQIDRRACLDRFERLVARLRILATTSRSERTASYGQP